MVALFADGGVVVVVVWVAAEIRRASRLVVSTPGAPTVTAVTSPFVLENTDKLNTYPMAKLSSLVSRRIDVTSQTTLPSISACKVCQSLGPVAGVTEVDALQSHGCCSVDGQVDAVANVSQVFVPEALANPEALTATTDYLTLVELPELFSLEDTDVKSLAELRDRLVELGKAHGRIGPRIPATEFQLRVRVACVVSIVRVVRRRFLLLHASSPLSIAALVVRVCHVSLVRWAAELRVKSRCATCPCGGWRYLCPKLTTNLPVAR